MSSKLLEQLNLVIEAATQARTIVLENMARDAKRQAKCRQLSRDSHVTPREERGEEGEKGTLPPAPPLKGKGEEEGKGERKQQQQQRACARETSPERSPTALTSEELFTAILAHWEKYHYQSDPQDFYLMNAKRGWHDKEGVPIASWQDAAKSWERKYRKLHEPKPEPTAPAEAIPPPNFTREDWVLCEERCARFKDGACICGVRVPPAMRVPCPAPPEECEHFEKGPHYRENVYGK